LGYGLTVLHWCVSHSTYVPAQLAAFPKFAKPQHFHICTTSTLTALTCLHNLLLSPHLPISQHLLACTTCCFPQICQATALSHLHNQHTHSTYVLAQLAAFSTFANLTAPTCLHNLLLSPHLPTSQHLRACTTCCFLHICQATAHSHLHNHHTHSTYVLAQLATFSTFAKPQHIHICTTSTLAAPTCLHNLLLSPKLPSHSTFTSAQPAHSQHLRACTTCCFLHICQATAHSHLHNQHTRSTYVPAQLAAFSKIAKPQHIHICTTSTLTAVAHAYKHSHLCKANVRSASMHSLLLVCTTSLWVSALSLCASSSQPNTTCLHTSCCN